MKRALLDSSVYGRLVEEPEIIEILEKKVPGEFVIYGSKTIRKELRDTPRYVRHRGRNLRIFLLNIYDKLVRDHELGLNKLVEVLSSDYFKEYIRRGGSRSDRKMRNDLLIIATATIYNLDIVVSDDEKTMLSALAIRTYKIVNQKYRLRNPDFLPYRRFKADLKNQERPL